MNMVPQLCKNQNIVWDYRTGEIIDVNTGEVIGQIYDVDAPQLFYRRKDNDDTTAVISRYGYKPRHSRQYYRLLEKHKEAIRLKENGFTVHDGYYRGKPRSIISSASSLVFDRLKDDTISDIVERGKKILEKHKYYELIISGRTERFIIILSYVLGKIDSGEEIRKRELKALFNVSERMYKDIKRVLRFFFGIYI